MRKVIPLNTKEEICRKAKNYVSDLELFIEERGSAVPLLLKALKYADPDLKNEIIFLLGTFAKEQVVESLYYLVSDSKEDEDVRHNAAIQLSIVLPHLKDPTSINNQLIANLKSPDNDQRLYATIALGWEGNIDAAISLIDMLYDPDRRIQQCAVNALTNLREERLWNLLLDRLKHSGIEQQRAILFNLWRFSGKESDAASVYARYLVHKNPDLRFNALVLLSLVANVRDYLDLYKRCLKDKDSRIRRLAIKGLGEEKVSELKEEIKDLLQDCDMEVKKAALETLKQLC